MNEGGALHMKGLTLAYSAGILDATMHESRRGLLIRVYRNTRIRDSDRLYRPVLEAMAGRCVSEGIAVLTEDGVTEMLVYKVWDVCPGSGKEHICQEDVPSMRGEEHRTASIEQSAQAV